MFSGMHYVYEVYKTKSFSKAAKNLYISQPALSAMIKKIEGKVGAPLFDRCTNPVQLTEYGKRYIKIAEKIMDLEDEFAYYTDNLDELKTGHLSIGSVSFFVSYILPGYISTFSSAYPNVKINLFESDSYKLEQKAASGELDLVIDNYQVDPKQYKTHTLTEEHLLLAVPASFHANRSATRYQLSWEDVKNNVHLNPTRPGISLKKFANEPLLTLRQPNDTRKRMEAIYQNAGVKFSPILKLDQLLTMYHMIEYGLGLSFVSDTLIKCLPYNPNVIYYKLEDPNTVRYVTLYYKNSKYLTRSMQEFIKIVLLQNENSSQP
ncbi:MAG: LysR family transcriptional regulator [Lachnospiraceae bacterium]|jgi:DNA-binding transcriptional LysR family regulator|nr:LysR family transcriptional regulator [Lachnospiraceae bacterium]